MGWLVALLSTVLLVAVVRQSIDVETKARSRSLGGSSAALFLLLILLGIGFIVAASNRH